MENIRRWGSAYSGPIFTGDLSPFTGLSGACLCPARLGHEELSRIFWNLGFLKEFGYCNSWALSFPCKSCGLKKWNIRLGALPCLQLSLGHDCLSPMPFLIGGGSFKWAVLEPYFFRQKTFSILCCHAQPVVTAWWCAPLPGKAWYSFIKKLFRWLRLLILQGKPRWWFSLSFGAKSVIRARDIYVLFTCL